MIGIASASLITNLYFAQPLVQTIGSDLGISPAWSGSVVSAIQVGYAIGLFFIVPLADFVENRRLVMTCMGLAFIGTVALAAAPSAWPFLIASLMTGICASCAQVLVPFLTHVIEPRRHGRVIGSLAAGILLAIMLARPAALFIADAFDWRMIFWLSSGGVAITALALAKLMPRRTPTTTSGYLDLRSMLRILVAEPDVRSRALYQGLLFGSFTMFWAAMPVMLQNDFGLTQTQIGFFALVGVGGVFAAPLAGRFADRGHSDRGTQLSALMMSLAFLGSIWAGKMVAFVALAFMALAIDGAIQASQTFSRLIVLSVAPEVRGRVNSMYMTLVYSCGAIGSVLGVWTCVRFGWTVTALLGAAMGFAVVLMMQAKPRRDRREG